MWKFELVQEMAFKNSCKGSTLVSQTIWEKRGACFIFKAKQNYQMEWK